MRSFLVSWRENWYLVMVSVMVNSLVRLQVLVIEDVVNPFLLAPDNVPVSFSGVTTAYPSVSFHPLFFRTSSTQFRKLVLYFMFVLPVNSAYKWFG
jgi:hypothetical protein